MTRPSAHLPGLSAGSLILADADRKSAGVLAFGFERAGATVVQATSTDDMVRLAAEGKGEIIVLSLTPALGLEALQALRAEAAGGKIPVVAVVALGAPQDRAAALAAGATDYLDQPAYVRDVVTLARLLSSRKDKASASLSGEIAHHEGIFHLIRAISSSGRTGVLTVLRGLRRGEIRYFQGEVTSAQVGTLHGMAGLHQLLLWSEGRFDFRPEAVVRRQQIPLSPAELLEDCGRFVRDFQQVAGQLTPGAIYEQDLRRVAECVEKIPKEVGPVLRLFDGGRTLADVVEDSQFRVFDTVKIACRLFELGTLRVASSARGRTGAAMALSVDDWRVGDTTPSLGVPLPIADKESEPIGPRPGEPASPPEAMADTAPPVDASTKKKRKKERQEQRAAEVDVPNVDWGKLPTGARTWEMPSFAPVVPSQVVAGEISERPAAAQSRQLAGHAPPAPDVSLASAAVAVARDLAVATDTALGSTAVLMVTSDATPVDQPLPVVVEGLLAGQPREPLATVLDEQARAGVIADGPLEGSNGTGAAHLVAAAQAVAEPAPAPETPAPAAETATRAAETATPAAETATAAAEAPAPAAEAGSLEQAPVTEAAPAESITSAAITARTPLVPDATPPAAVEPAAELAPPAAPVPIEPLAAVAAAAELPAAQGAEGTPFDVQPDTVPFEKPVEEPVDTAPFELAPPEPAAPPMPSPSPSLPVPEAAPPRVLVDPLASVSGELVSAAVRNTPPVSGEIAAVVPEPDLAAAAEPAPAPTPTPPPAAEPPRAPEVLAAPPVLPEAVRQEMEQAVARTAAHATEAAHVAAGFDDLEEEFFSQERQFADAIPAPVDHFEDLNDGTPPPSASGFWKRLFGGKPQPSAPPAARPARAATPIPAAGSTPAPPQPASAGSSSSSSPSKPRQGQGKGNQKHRKRR